jgi:ribonuclease BN (tRNA processing enzyme)
MKLTVLGSGTGFPSSTRGGPGYLLQTGRLSVLMDLGSGTLAKLHGLGVSLERIGPILITHLHPDHVAELVSLLFALKNILLARREPLRFIGCSGLAALVKKLEAAHGEWIRPKDFRVEIDEMVEETLSLGDLRITAVPVEHTAGSVGFRVTDGSRAVLAYSGDTDFCPALIDLVRGADLAVLECSFPDEKKCAGHLTPGEAAQAASRGGVSRLMLSHFYPECDGVDLIAQCRPSFNGEVILAHDLLELTL